MFPESLCLRFSRYKQMSCPRKEEIIEGIYGCKYQQLINKMIFENCRRTVRNLSNTWIYYQKAIDSVPHVLTVKVLEMYNLYKVIINFLKYSQKPWKSTLYLKPSKGTGTFSRLNIRRAIFQGGPCHLHKLKRNFKKLFTHILHINDLKFFVKDENYLKGLLNTVNVSVTI